MLKEEVDEEDIARIVSKWTAFRSRRCWKAKVKKLVTMEERLRNRVSDRTRLSNALPTPFAVPAPDSAIQASDWLVHFSRSDRRW